MSIIRKIIILLMVSLIIIFVTNNLLVSATIDTLNPKATITEIMFNPEGSDSGNEWIEIYSTECINLTKYKFYEAEINHKITPYNQDNSTFCNYAIISNNPEIFLSKYRNSSYSLDENNFQLYESSFSLNNNGEIIGLKLGEEFIDYIDYELILQYITIYEGNSLELSNNTWISSKQISGNPGNHDINITDTNSLNDSNESIINEQVIETATENTTITETNVSEVIINYTNSNYVDYNHSNYTSNNNSISNSTSSNNSQLSSYEECIINLSITFKENLTGQMNNFDEIIAFRNDEEIKFQNKIIIYSRNISSTNITNQAPKIFEEFNYSIEYWIEDIFGNIVKNKIVTSSSTYKSYTPKIKTRNEILIIKNKLLSISSGNISCEINNTKTIFNNQTSQKIILIINENYVDYKSSDNKDNCTKLLNEKIKEIKSNYSIIQINEPTIKIINVCNNTQNIISYDEFENNTEKLFESSSLIKYSSNEEISSKELEMNYTIIDKNENKTIETGADSRISSRIIYESENIKNKIYAVIGIMIIIIASTGMFVYRIYKRK